MTIQCFVDSEQHNMSGVIKIATPPRKIMTAEENLQRIRDQNNARAKRYYLKHKADIATRRKNQRQAVRSVIAAAGPPPDHAKMIKAAQPLLPVAPPAPAPPAPAPPAAAAAPARRRGRPVRGDLAADHGPLTKEAVIVAFAARENIPSDATLSTDKSNLNTIERITGITDFRRGLQNSAVVIGKIDTAKQANSNKTYKPNSKKSYLQTLLKMMDTPALGIQIDENDRRAYDDKFQYYAAQSLIQTQKKQQEQKVVNFDDYIAGVKAKFGIGKQFLIASLYDVGGFRDDLNSLHIVASKAEANDGSKNYAVVPKNDAAPLEIIVNQYKTSGKFGVNKVIVPVELSSQIRDYMSEKKLTYGDYLFGKSRLSQYIIEFSKQAGFPGVKINELRSMKVSKERTDDPQQQVESARAMRHSVQTAALVYARKEKEKQPVAPPVAVPARQSRRRK